MRDITQVITYLLNHKEYIATLIAFIALLGSMYKLVEQIEFRKIKTYKVMMEPIDKHSLLYKSLKQAQEESVTQWLFGGKSIAKSDAEKVHKLYQLGVFSKDEICVFIPYLDFSDGQLKMNTPKCNIDVWFAIVLTAIVSSYLIPVGAILMLSSSAEAPLNYFAGIAVIVFWAFYGRWAFKPYLDYCKAKKHKPTLDKMLAELTVAANSPQHFVEIQSDVNWV